MKIYVKNSAGDKIYLDYPGVKTRQELKDIIGSNPFTLDGTLYYIFEVKAESSAGNAFAGAAIGGLIGLLAGPIGVLAGGAIGSLIGGSDSEAEEVKKFNDSKT